MVRYVKCPRCELNYMDEDKQEYCDICIAEMKGNKLQFADLDDEDYEELEAELEQTEICPVCGVNSIRYGEKMCEACRKENEYKDEEEVDIDKDEEWKNYLDEDDSDLTVDNDTLEEELEEELEEDAEEPYDDDFFDEDLEPLDDLDEEDEEDDEDFDDDDF